MRLTGYSLLHCPLHLSGVINVLFIVILSDLADLFEFHIQQRYLRSLNSSALQIFSDVIRGDQVLAMSTLVNSVVRKLVSRADVVLAVKSWGVVPASIGTIVVVGPFFPKLELPDRASDELTSAPRLCIHFLKHLPSAAENDISVEYCAVSEGHSFLALLQ
ncbi:hypothetical protein BDP27DRAFT_339172 [Rhodocollybia butyracea]|uniref:Uncharacterized protein n=1 Tax=Rhodocollybia butyracea TaxID=206335 RepID=A0A9P5QBJ4_9AGAR|nr:hypothetical protein BDP27DRAFT_339172 [Rhodocollybia butyracea]